jgi:hypothetical protein
MQRCGPAAHGPVAFFSTKANGAPTSSHKISAEPQKQGVCRTIASASCLDRHFYTLESRSICKVEFLLARQLSFLVTRSYRANGPSIEQLEPTRRTKAQNCCLRASLHVEDRIKIT